MSITRAYPSQAVLTARLAAPGRSPAPRWLLRTAVRALLNPLRLPALPRRLAEILEEDRLRADGLDTRHPPRRIDRRDRSRLFRIWRDQGLNALTNALAAEFPDPERRAGLMVHLARAFAPAGGDPLRRALLTEAVALAAGGPAAAEAVRALATLDAARARADEDAARALAGEDAAPAPAGEDAALDAARAPAGKSAALALLAAAPLPAHVGRRPATPPRRSPARRALTTVLRRFARPWTLGRLGKDLGMLRAENRLVAEGLNPDARLRSPLTRARRVALFEAWRRGEAALDATLAAAASDAATRAALLAELSPAIGGADADRPRLALLRCAAALDFNDAVAWRLLGTAQRAHAVELVEATVGAIEAGAAGAFAPATVEQARRAADGPLAPFFVTRLLRSPRPASRAAFVPGRVLYVLHNSLPYASAGYATRAIGLAAALNRQGLEVLCLTRPGYPLDTVKALDPAAVPGEETVEGVTHLRDLSLRRGAIRQRDYLRASADRLGAIIAARRPEVVLAASNYQVGLPAAVAARRAGVPFAYEVRGLWELTRLSREPDYDRTVGYALQAAMETAVCAAADRVYTLTAGMRDHLAGRGLDPERVMLAPNCFAPERFAAAPRDAALAGELGLPEDAPVIGYVGTFAQYEGLDDLARACAILKAQGRRFRLLLVGSEDASGAAVGPIGAEVRRIAEAGGFGDWLVMPGRVPHEAVARWYSLIDVCPFPRKPQPVTELVSPMKPLEAMAMEKAVVVSSVAALAEMVRDGETGRVFAKGSVEALAAALGALLDDPAARRALGARARAWAAAERSWDVTARRMAEDLARVSAEWRPA